MAMLLTALLLVHARISQSQVAEISLQPTLLILNFRRLMQTESKVLCLSDDEWMMKTCLTDLYEETLSNIQSYQWNKHMNTLRNLLFDTTNLMIQKYFKSLM